MLNATIIEPKIGLAHFKAAKSKKGVKNADFRRFRAIHRELECTATSARTFVL